MLYRLLVRLRLLPVIEVFDPAVIYEWSES